MPRGAWIVYPNYYGLPPGARRDFWHYEPDEGWYVYGQGTVTADGSQVVPDRRTRIDSFTGAMFNDGENPPDGGPNHSNGADDGEPGRLKLGHQCLLRFLRATPQRVIRLRAAGGFRYGASRRYADSSSSRSSCGSA